MDQKLQDKIGELRAKLHSLESKRATLGDDLVNEMQAIIKDQLRLLQNTGSGGQFHETVTAMGDVAGRDINNFYTGRYQGKLRKPRNKPWTSTGNSSPIATAISR